MQRALVIDRMCHPYDFSEALRGHFGRVFKGVTFSFAPGHRVTPDGRQPVHTGGALA